MDIYTPVNVILLVTFVVIPLILRDELNQGLYKRSLSLYLWGFALYYIVPGIFQLGLFLALLTLPIAKLFLIGSIWYMGRTLSERVRNMGMAS